MEKEGSNLRKESQMTGFREALEVCRLGDLGFSGSMYTWSNRRADGTFTKERLDLAMANPEWCTIFPSFFGSDYGGENVRSQPYPC